MHTSSNFKAIIDNNRRLDLGIYDVNTIILPNVLYMK